MKPSLPDILSLTRIVGALLLFIPTPLTPAYLGLYLYCCISDFVDGYLARKNGGSPYGQTLDSAADIILTASLLLTLVPWLPWDWWMIEWIVALIVMRVTSVIIGTIKFKQMALLHTRLNKYAGVFRYVAPFALMVLDLDVTVFLVCAMTTIATIEDFIINLTSKELNRDIVSIFNR